MTRKRFTKLLMGVFCLDRNKAQACADTVKNAGGSYLDGLQAFTELYIETCAQITEDIMQALYRETTYAIGGCFDCQAIPIPEILQPKVKAEGIDAILGGGPL